MNAAQSFLEHVSPGVRRLYAGWLEGLDGDSLPDWTVLQGRLLESIDAYAAAEMERPADYGTASHEAGGQCRVWFPHYRMRGNPGMLKHMSAILEARTAWAGEHLFHGYPDGHEVHHEPETFLYFQVPYMHLTRDRKAVEAVEDLAHHAGNWEPGVPDWYDWKTHGFRSTWLGTREVRAFPPYDYQEANHFRFAAIALASYASTRKARYLDLAEDYAGRWCAHILAHARGKEPIPCSILPEGAQRSEMLHAGVLKSGLKKNEYPVFYMTVASNTAYDISTVLLDLYRITGRGQYRESAGAMIAQFFENSDELGRPAYGFAGGAWVAGHAGGKSDYLSRALRGTNVLLVRMACKYRACTGDTRFDAPLLRWAESVAESRRMEDQVHIGLLVAAHGLTGDTGMLARAYAMALRGMAATEDDPRWHQCDSHTRYGFRCHVEDAYNSMLAGVDYATRGGLPQVGLSYETPDGPGLPEGVAVRAWTPSPEKLRMEAANTGIRPAAWRISGGGTGIEPERMEAAGCDLKFKGGGWVCQLPAGGRAWIRGLWAREDRAPEF